MSTDHIVRAWKDAEYRLGLTDDDRGALPSHPAGPIELGVHELDAAAGGGPTHTSTFTGPGCSQTPCSDNIGPCRTFRCTQGCIVWG